MERVLNTNNLIFYFAYILTATLAIALIGTLTVTLLSPIVVSFSLF